MIIGILCCLLVLLFGLLIFEVGIFRLSCSICDVPRPGLWKSLGIVMLLLIVPAIIDAIDWAILVEIYNAAEYPLWEAGVIEFFIALPIHMILCATIHARMMSLTVRECLAVWFVEKLIKLGLILSVGGMVAIMVLTGVIQV